MNDNEWTKVVKIGEVIDYPKPVFAASQVCELLQKKVTTIYLEARINRWSRLLIPFPRKGKYLIYFLAEDIYTHYQFKQVDGIEPFTFADDPVYFVPHLIHLTGETRQNFWWWAKRDLKGEIKQVSHISFVRKQAWDKFWRQRQKGRKGG